MSIQGTGWQKKDDRHGTTGTTIHIVNVVHLMSVDDIAECVYD